MNDALFAVQQAIFAVLAASAEIQALLGSPPRLYDHVPPGAAFPYATFGGVTALPYDTKTESGLEQVVTINVWSRYRGAMETKDILQAIYDSLHRANLSVSGQVFLSCEFHSADTLLLDDGLTTHGSARYTVITQTT